MKTLLIDGNNLIHRTFWTAKTQSKRTETDTPEQLSNFHIYFTLNAVLSYVTKFQPDQTIIVWDEKPDYQPNTRKTLFEEYKGNRSKDTAPHQNNIAIRQMLSYLGIKSMYPRQLEADDIIAFLTNSDVIPGDKIIVSVDKDFTQCVNSHTILYDPIRKTEININNFEEMTGWEDVHAWLDAKCLMGDKSDNVPGIPKFGKAKVKKFRASRHNILTLEQREIYQRNLKLFNLTTAIFCNPEEQQYYNEQLAVETVFNSKKFFEECKQRNFNSILNKKESWYSLFFMKNQLKNIFG